MQEVKKSLTRIVEKECRSDAHLLFQAADEAQAIEVARRIHEQSERAGQPFVVYDARQLLGAGNAKQVLDAFNKGALSPGEEVGGGTLVILHMEETPEDFQHVFAKILDVNFRDGGSADQWARHSSSERPHHPRRAAGRQDLHRHPAHVPFLRI